MPEPRPRATVLVTRPEPENAALRAALEADGYRAISCPMQTIRALADAPPPPPGAFAAVAFTSANGVRALAALSPARDLPAFCVGAATAEAAAAAGFAIAGTTACDGAALARRIAAAGPHRRPILHASGTEIAADLAALLAPAGVSVVRLPVYTADPAPALPPAAAAALRAGAADAVLLFSPRAAALFSRFASDAQFAAGAARLSAVALSEPVLRALSAPVARRVVAGARSADSLRAALDAAFPA